MRLLQPDPSAALLALRATKTVAASGKWDYWPYVGLPIDETRRRLNIVPAG
jgi:hypothetical protein